MMETVPNDRTKTVANKKQNWDTALQWHGINPLSSDGNSGYQQKLITTYTLEVKLLLGIFFIEFCKVLGGKELNTSL